MDNPKPGEMTTYDEDLSENPFYQTFLQAYVDLFSQCVCEKWIICVPRKDSLPKHAFTLEDFTHHILKPLRTCVELKSRNLGSGGESISSSSNSSSIQNLSSLTSSSNLNVSTSTINSTGSATIENGPTRNWNFRTLNDVKLEYKDSKLFFNVESPRKASAVINNISTGHPRSISVLFEETYYTPDKQKYKVLCIASPLNSKVEDLDPTNENENDFDGVQNNGGTGSTLWNLTSLRDCIDFLWLNGKAKALENFDAYIKLFLHNHQTLEDLPLAVQRDLVFDAYKKCLSFAVKSAVASMSRSASVGNNNPNTTNIDILAACSPLNETPHLLQNFKLATETYVLSGIYRQLMNAVTSALSFEDASFNKITRNLSEIHPQDLDIKSCHWDNLTRAKNELGRLNLYASPLAKLNCLRKTMGYLRHDTDDSREDESIRMISTDELLPMWVYLIVKTPLGNWMAQLQFLRQFRFSAINTPDNENSFIIVTLEASMAHLSSGKINGVSEAEVDVGMTCEIGDMFLRNLSPLCKEGKESPLAEMFNIIRQGSFCKLENLVNAYETQRTNLLASLQNGSNLRKLCHPLCNCLECAGLTQTASEANKKSIFELTNEDGLTLLHVACVYGRPKIVDFLLTAGSPYSAVDNLGMRPLHYAASRGHQNALLLLLHAGASLDPLDKNLETPLHHAAKNGHETCVKALIYYAEHSRQSVGLNARNINADTPLHFAARSGFQGIVTILVDIGASITVPNAKQATVLDCAHDIHILRILQRSMRRRDLIHTNHGDFVNIDVVKKESSDGVVMLISEPNKAQDSNESESNSYDSKSTAKASIASDSRRSSAGSQSLISDTIVSGRVKRDISTSPASHNLYGAKFVGTTRRRLSGNDSSSIEESQCVPNGNAHLINDITDVDTDFFVPSPPPLTLSGPEDLRRVSVESLEISPNILSETAAVTGLKRKRDAKEQGLRKLFTAIKVGDVPLALYYLGISAEELDRVDEVEPGELFESVPCHPLCSCNRCSAKNSGLDVSINVRSQEGLTILQMAVQYNLHSLVKILLKYKADPRLYSTREHKTATQFAKENYFTDIANTLEQWEAATSLPDGTRI